MVDFCLHSTISVVVDSKDDVIPGNLLKLGVLRPCSTPVAAGAGQTTGGNVSTAVCMLRARQSLSQVTYGKLLGFSPLTPGTGTRAKKPSFYHSPFIEGKKLCRFGFQDVLS